MFSFFYRALTVCAAPTLVFATLLAPALEQRALAQPDPQIKPIGDLPSRALALVDAEKLVSRPPIVLHLRDVTLRDALQTLQKQTGVALTPFLDTDHDTLNKKVSIDLETRSFKDAFRALTESANVKATLREVSNGATINRWSVVFDPEAEDVNQAPQSGVGPFQVRVNSLTTFFYKQVMASAGTFTRTQNNHLTIEFGLVFDPRMSGAELSVVKLTRAEDQTGNSLLRALFSDLPQRVNSRSNYRFDDLYPVPADAQKLAHLEGVAIYAWPTRREKWEIPDLLNAIGEVHQFESKDRIYFFRIVSVQRDDNKVDIQLEAGPFFNGDQNFRFMRMEDANGQTLLFQQGDFDDSEGVIKFGAQFALNQTSATKPTLSLPLKLSFDVPVDWVQTAVPFSFTDVPLPQSAE